MRDIAAYFSGEPLKPDAQARWGRRRSRRRSAWRATARTASASQRMYPTLAGQHADYLARALHEYKKGGRKNPIMATFAEQL